MSGLAAGEHTVSIQARLNLRQWKLESGWMCKKRGKETIMEIREPGENGEMTSLAGDQAGDAVLPPEQGAGKQTWLS